MASACASGPAPAPPEAPLHNLPEHTLTGMVSAIELQNINKAQGHFTYNVELVLSGIAVNPRPPTMTDPLRVRVGQSVGWDKLSAGEQAAIAPSGPQQVLSAQEWRGYRVGEPANVRVHLTGPGLAHLIVRAD